MTSNSPPPNAPAPTDVLLGLALQPIDDDPEATHAVLDAARGVELGRGSRAACELIRLGALERRYGVPLASAALPTLGGAQVWRDETVYCGYRIQRLFSGKASFRLLDASDRLLVRGTFEACRVALERQRLDLRLTPRGPHGVVMLHGLFRTRRSMLPLRRRLEAAGFETIPVDYPSTRGTLEEHAAQVERVLCELRGVETVSFVTHSMGGLVARCVLGRHDAGRDWRARLTLGRLLMLFPPNNGSQRADFWRRFKWLAPLTGSSTRDLGTAHASLVPIPEVRLGIIAGGRGGERGRSRWIEGDNDGTVSVAEAWLPGAEEFRILDVGHTAGLKDERVLDAAIGYLSTGSMVEALAKWTE